MFLFQHFIFWFSSNWQHASIFTEDTPPLHIHDHSIFLKLPMLIFQLIYFISFSRRSSLLNSMLTLQGPSSLLESVSDIVQDTFLAWRSHSFSRFHHFGLRHQVSLHMRHAASPIILSPHQVLFCIGEVYICLIVTRSTCAVTSVNLLHLIP